MDDSPSSPAEQVKRPESANSQSSKESSTSELDRQPDSNSLPNSRRSNLTDTRSNADIPIDLNAGGDTVRSKDGEKGVKFLEEDVICPSESESDIEIREVSDSSSLALDTPGEGCARPLIARGFRPEVQDDFVGIDISYPKRSVSFEGNRSSLKLVDDNEMRGFTYSGEEVTLVPVDTQTDWEWVREAAASSEVTDEKKSVTEVKPAEEAQTHVTFETEATVLDDRGGENTPYTPYSDEFGIPVMDISSDSDDSSDDDSWKKQQDNRNFLPSIGPPQILQYLRESEKQDLEHKDGETGDYPVDEFGHPVGMFGGTCEFCGEEILPFPSVEKQQTLPPDELYCCDEYREFIQFATTTAVDLEAEVSKKQRVISVKPHPHFGTKKDRKAAKERAVQRMRDRELQRRQQEASGMQQNFFSSTRPGSRRRGSHPSGRAGHGDKSSAQPQSNLAASQFRGGLANLDVARQMKTINYQLSSQRCLDEGWTLRPPSPLLKLEEECEVFIPEPLNPEMIASGKLVNRSLIEKYYDDGQKFLTIFSDGSGNVFYPSGQLAISITSVTLGQYIYIIHDDTPKHEVTAIFEPNGYGSCFHLNGIVRVYFDQLGGMELDAVGARKKKWLWRDPEIHVHAPPFQPICFGLNHWIGVRIMGQDNISVTMTAKKRSCRFNVGSKLKLVAPENLPPKEIDETHLFLSEKSAYVENVLHKVSTLLKFPKSPKLDKILPPIHVTTKMQRNEKLRKQRALATSRDKKQQLTLPAVKVI